MIRGKIGNENAAGEAQDAIAGAADSYSAIWDSSAVPDDFGYIRFCAIDEVKLWTCTLGQWVKIENRVVVPLKAGWNLISTPLNLYDADVDSALMHLVAHGTVDKIFAYSGGNWTSWKLNGPDGLKNVNLGQGYWIHMVAPDALTFVGTWLDLDLEPATPPEFAVNQGWNLIGYSHWGTPTDAGFDSTVQEYLGTQLSPAVESMYRWDAGMHSYLPVGLNNKLMQGSGYWLALSQAGTINP